MNTAPGPGFSKLLKSVTMVTCLSLKISKKKYSTFLYFFCYVFMLELKRNINCIKSCLRALTLFFMKL